MTTKPTFPATAAAGTMEMDHREISFPEGATVLRAAELNGIYVPSLCSHKDLSPFGGCRLCMVEIEGMRGYPMACSTAARSGMKVLTETSALRDMRKEILQLILSEHPSSCLVCSEKDLCRDSQQTIRKVGVSTGCRFCPKDGQCELQAVVERVGVTDVAYPVHYRGYPPEHDDPFFDRDYNICILCGRCVRMCQELRGAAVLAFTHRGPMTRIGPAFGATHVEGGCEFCGACVSVCPTGALADKASKWDGKPDGREVSTCPFCAIGCQVELHVKQGRLSRVEANLDPEVNDGQLCLKGRFCMPETAHHHARVRKPMLRKGRYVREVSWDDALDAVAEKLKGVKPEEFLMLVSPDLTNESLFAAQRFVRGALGADGIDSTARFTLPGGLGLWTRLLSLPASIRAVAEADAVLAAGFDARFSFSVVGVQIRRALKKGAVLTVIDMKDTILARRSDHWLNPLPPKEAVLLRAVLRLLMNGASADEVHSEVLGTGVSDESVRRAVESLGSGGRLAVVLGPRLFECVGRNALLDTLESLARNPSVTIVPLYHGANTRGLIELGAVRGLRPGVVPVETGEGPSLESLITAASSSSHSDRGSSKGAPRVLYLVGESPLFERPPCEFIIAQDLYPAPFEVDAFLPAASFAAAEGTLTNIEGRVQRLSRVEAFPDSMVTGMSRPDWFIFGELARRLGFSDLIPKDAAAILAAIHEELPHFPGEPDRRPRPMPHPGNGSGQGLTVESERSLPRGRGKFLVIAEASAFRHRGFDLSRPVEALSELGLEEGFRLNPADLEKLGVKPGADVAVSINGANISGPARADAEVPRGVAFFHRVHGGSGVPHREPMAALSALPSGIFRSDIEPCVPRPAVPAGAAARRTRPGRARGE